METALTKRLVCLANSRKVGGACVAGKEIVERRVAGWVRPVSSREEGELSQREQQYPDGTDARVLDKMEVPLLSPQPHGCQTENWRIDPSRRWERKGQIEWKHLRLLADPPGPLWINGSSTFHGENDQIDAATAATLDGSLRLVHVEKLALAVFAPSKKFDNPKRRIQARFHHHGTLYKLWVTCPIYEREYLAKPDGEHELGESYVTVSIGEPYKDYCYKLVAAVMERARVEGE